MKVLQVIGGGEKGGSKNHIITLSKELIKKGIHTEIVCFLDDTVIKAAKDNNIPYSLIPMKNTFDVRAIAKLRKHIQKKKSHIIHTHGFRANVIGRLAARNAGLPIITTIHSSIYHDYTNAFKKTFYHRIEKLTRPYTTKFITVAESLKKELMIDGVESKRIQVVYNGLSPDFPLEKKRNPFIRQELGLKEHIPILTNIGRAEGVKNQIMLIQVFASLKQNKIPYYGLIVGDGPLLEELKLQAQNLNVSENVYFLGFRNDIYELLSESDIFLLTSKMEGLPITILEAMATKTPVVLTEVGGIPEIIKIAQNGFVIPVDDTDQFMARIQEILVQPELKQKFEEKGYQALLRHFTYDKFVENTIRVYEEVLIDQKKRKVDEVGS